MKHHTLLIGVTFSVFVAVMYATEQPSIDSIELNWPDRFTATVEGNQYSQRLSYTYDYINQRDRMEQASNVTIRTKNEDNSIEIRWNRDHVALPVKCEEKTIEDWSLMPKNWFSSFNKTLVFVNTAMPDYSRNFASVQFQWRFRVRASQLASLFFVPKTVPLLNNYRDTPPELQITKVKNILVTVMSSAFDPTWPQEWTIDFDLPEQFKNQNQYLYAKGLRFSVKKTFVEELVPLYFDKLFEVPSYIKECTRVDLNPPTQPSDDDNEDF